MTFLRKFRFLDEVFASMTLKIPFALHSNRNAIISRVPATVAIWSVKWFVFILETEFRIAWPIKTSKCRSWLDWASEEAKGIEIVHQGVRITSSNGWFRRSRVTLAPWQHFSRAKFFVWARSPSNSLLLTNHLSRWRHLKANRDSGKRTPKNIPFDCLQVSKYLDIDEEHWFSKSWCVDICKNCHKTLVSFSKKPRSLDDELKSKCRQREKWLVLKGSPKVWLRDLLCRALLKHVIRSTEPSLIRRVLQFKY